MNEIYQFDYKNFELPDCFNTPKNEKLLYNALLPFDVENYSKITPIKEQKANIVNLAQTMKKIYRLTGKLEIKFRWSLSTVKAHADYNAIKNIHTLKLNSRYLGMKKQPLLAMHEITHTEQVEKIFGLIPCEDKNFLRALQINKASYQYPTISNFSRFKHQISEEHANIVPYKILKKFNFKHIYNYNIMDFESKQEKLSIKKFFKQLLRIISCYAIQAKRPSKSDLKKALNEYGLGYNGNYKESHSKLLLCYIDQTYKRNMRRNEFEQQIPRKNIRGFIPTHQRIRGTIRPIIEQKRNNI